jgi:hypothetical protein
MRKLQVDLLKYADINIWSPKIGDMLFCDGLFIRWCALVEGIDADSISVKKSGNLRLLVNGECKEEVINIRKIKSSMIGSYWVSSDGTYYV